MSNPTFSQIYDEDTGTTYDIKSITDATLSEIGTPADAKATGDALDILVIDKNTPDAISVNYGITTAGYAFYNTNYKIIKYNVTEGQRILIKSTTPDGGKANFAFYTSNSISQTSIDNLVGEPVNTQYGGHIIIPEGAKIIAFSCLADDDATGVYVSTAISEIKADVDFLSTKIETVTNGTVLNVNVPKAQDGKSYGNTDFYFPIFKGQEITITNNQASNNNWSCTLKNSEDETLANFNVEKGVTKTITVQVDNVAYMRVYQNVYPLVGKIVAESVDAYQNRILESVSGVVEKTTDIVSLNYAVPKYVKSSQKLLYGKTVIPLTLLHFSDPHATKGNVARMVQIGNSLGSLIDDTICTGDMVNDKYADGYTWWGDIEGAEKILTCIGNHDVSDGSNYNAYGITPEQAYNTYFAPYISNWGVEHAGIQTYYYKDYVSKKIRLIALDYLLTDDDAVAQNTWLQSVLSDAITNNYTVVIIQHCPVTNEEVIDCAFSMLNKRVTYDYPIMYQESVQTFINNGGDFACYLAGHTHWDTIGYNNDYPNQICVVVTCTAITGRDNDQVRVSGTKSQDAANIVTIDTNTHTIKLIRIGANIDNYLRKRNICTINYNTKQVIAED